MRSKNRQRLSDQLTLFAPTVSLCWKDLPAEARSRVVKLLALLLREYRVQCSAEVRDE